MSTGRFITVTQKIGRAATGLNGALYVHMDYTAEEQLKAVRFSHKGKDNSTLDNVLTALGDTVTDIIKEVDKP